MRVRARRRRRQVFMVLVDMTVLTLMMGLFPPFRVMLYGTGALAFILLAYSALLVKIREEELARARQRAAMEREQAYRILVPAARTRAPVMASGRYAAPAYAAGNGRGRVHANGNGNAHANGNGRHVGANGNGTGQANGNGGHANGNGHPNESGRSAFADILREGGVEIIEDDVHVIVRPVGQVAPRVG
jgi:hypothetical protein